MSGFRVLFAWVLVSFLFEWVVLAFGYQRRMFIVLCVAPGRSAGFCVFLLRAFLKAVCGCCVGLVRGVEVSIAISDDVKGRWSIIIYWVCSWLVKVGSRA